MKMQSGFTIGLLRCLVLAAITIPLGASVADDDAILKAKRTVTEFLSRKYSGEQKDAYMLNATHMGDLEASLLSLRVRTKYLAALPAYIYRITEDGWFVIPESNRAPNDHPLVWSGSADGHREWIVAVSRDSGEAYGLYGFDESEKGFNALIRSTEIEVCTGCESDLAEDKDIALLYYRCTMDPDGGRLIQSGLDLKQRLERYAYSKYTDTKASTLSTNWWQAFVAAGGLRRIGIRSRRSGPDAEASVSFFQASLERNAMLRILTFRIRANGECELLKDEVAFERRVSEKQK
jgi:hypothetical protein